MALEGSIKDFGLADIFQLIHLQKKTGILDVRSEANQTRVSFENGMVVTANRPDHEDSIRIGEILLKAGKISQWQLDEALFSQRNGKESIGNILVGMGAILKEDLVRALGKQVSEIVYGLFRLTQGRYAFESSAIEYDRDFYVPINTEFLLMEGVRRVDEWPLIEKMIPSLDLTFVKNEERAGLIKGVKEEDEIAEGFGEPNVSDGIYLTPVEMAVYESLDFKKTVRALSEENQLGDFEVSKALSRLLTSNLIKQAATIKNASPSPERKPGVEDKVSGLRSEKARQWIRGVMLFILILGAALQFPVSVARSPELSRFYRNLHIEKEIERLAYGIWVYTYENNKFPDSMKAFTEERKLQSSDPILDSEGRELEIVIVGDMNSFRLESLRNRSLHNMSYQTYNPIRRDLR